METECLRNGRYFDNDAWNRFEEFYLVYRSASSKLGAEAIEQKKLGGVSDQNVTPWNMVCTISTAKI